MASKTISIKVDMIDNSGEVKEAAVSQALVALEECGFVADGYASKRAPVGKFQGGKLRDSISHQVQPSELVVYIGAGAEYSAYVELGTGIYYPGGRQTPWVYQDAQGNWHFTHGQRAQPYLKPAIADHVPQFKSIIEGEMKGG